MAGLSYPQKDLVCVTLKFDSSKILDTNQGFHEATQHETQE